MMEAGYHYRNGRWGDITKYMVVEMLGIGSTKGNENGDDKVMWFPVLCLYSHSMVAGGLDEMSSTTRLIPATSLVMRLETRERKS